jgi:enoyl-CoA hydratase/carnithine racemase
VGTRKYKTLATEETGNSLVVDIPYMIRDATTLFQLASDLSDVCGQIVWMEEIRVVLLAFSGEIKNQDSHSSGSGSGQICLTEPVARLKQPVIAAIRGSAFGLGLELALACDIRIGTEEARFGLPQICEGRLPSNGGTQRLPRLIGLGRAMQMILTGESMDAGDALRAGLINRVVTSEVLMRSAKELAREMATKSPLSLSYAKEALYNAEDLTLGQGLNKEMDLYLLLHSTHDRTEGVTAYREKRKPEFKGE